MRTRVLGGVVVAAIVAIVATRACTSDSGEVAAEVSADAPASPPPAAARTAHAPPPSLAAGAPGPPPPVEDADVARFTAARDALLQAAAPCVAGRASPPLTQNPAPPDETTQKLAFRYHLVVQGGVAHADRVERVTSAVRDAALERCLLAALAGARWPSDAPDGDTVIREHLRIGELLRVHRRAHAP